MKTATLFARVFKIETLIFLSLVSSNGQAQTLNGQFERIGPVAGLNSPYRDTQPFVSADGMTIYFTSDRPSEFAPVDWSSTNIWTATRNSATEAFGEPVKLRETINNDEIGQIGPSLAGGGLALYYFEGSGPGNGDGEILVSRRDSPSSPWRQANRVGPNVNRPGYDSVSSFVSDNELTIWFGAAVAGENDYSLFQANRATTMDDFEEAVPLEQVNTTEFSEGSPSLSENGLLMLYDSDRDGFGFQELWVATRTSTDGVFENPMTFNDLGIGDINTLFAAEAAPFLSRDWPADGAKLYFMSALDETDWDLYEATWSSNASAGDLDGNGIIDVADVDFLASAIRRNSSASGFDMDRSGMLNRNDLTFMVEKNLNTWVGDANIDGEFNSSDFVAVFQSGKYETADQASWSEGDWNADGVFDSGDFVNAFQGGGYEQGSRGDAHAVPEPYGWLGFAIGMAALVACHPKGRRDGVSVPKRGVDGASCVR